MPWIEYGEDQCITVKRESLYDGQKNGYDNRRSFSEIVVSKETAAGNEKALKKQFAEIKAELAKCHSEKNESEQLLEIQKRDLRNQVRERRRKELQAKISINSQVVKSCEERIKSLQGELKHVQTEARRVKAKVHVYSLRDSVKKAMIEKKISQKKLNTLQTDIKSASGIEKINNIKKEIMQNTMTIKDNEQLLRDCEGQMRQAAADLKRLKNSATDSPYKKNSTEQNKESENKVFLQFGNGLNKLAIFMGFFIVLIIVLTGTLLTTNRNSSPESVINSEATLN